MTLQYGIITSVFKDQVSGAQLCNVKGNLTTREYQNCEIITSKGQNYLPKKGDVAILYELHNSEIIILGVLEPYDLLLEEGEVLLHYGTISQVGQTSKYNLQAQIKLDKNKNIVVSTGNTTGNTFTPINSIKLENNGNVTIMSTTKVTLDAPNVEII